MAGTASLWPVSEIRRALEDDPKTPSFIETRTRRGYRFIAPVFNMQQDRSVTQHPGSGQKIVGRADALTTLRMSADRMLAEQPQIVCICGERGIGKTALAEEFLRRAQQDIPRFTAVP
jgi:DNA-binding NtrC family response regulator